jgi:hypothetical protein
MRGLVARVSLAVAAVVASRRAAEAADPHCEEGICYGICGGQGSSSPGAHGTGRQDDNGPCHDGNSAGCCEDPLELPSTGEDACACEFSACGGACEGICRNEDCPDAQYCGTSGHCEPCAAVKPKQLNTTCMEPDADCCTADFLAACPADPAQCSRRGSGFACGTHSDYFDNLNQFAELLRFVKGVCTAQLGEHDDPTKTVVPGTCASSDCSRLIHQVSDSCTGLLADPMFASFKQQLDPCRQTCEHDAFAGGTTFPITDSHVQQAAPITRCGGTLTDGIGIHNASRDGLDSVTILAPPGQTVRLSLISMYLQIGDAVQLFEGNSTDGDPMEELRGMELPAKRIFVSKGRSLTVRSIHDAERNAGLGKIFSFGIECVCADNSPGARSVVWDEVRALPNGTSLYSAPGTTCAVPSPTDFPTDLTLNMSLLNRERNYAFAAGQTNATWGGRPGPYVLAGPAKYAGGVLLLDGRVLLVPHNEDSIGLYDPHRNLFSTGPNVGSGNAKYAGGVLLPDGRVVFIPQRPYRNLTRSSSTGYYVGQVYIGIYDPRNNSFAFGPTNGFPLTFTDSGGIAGYIARFPNGSDYTTEPVYCGGVLLPDGRVVAVPAFVSVSGSTGSEKNHSWVGIYDPKTDAFRWDGGITETETTDTLPFAYSGGILMPDGRVLFVPNASTTIGLYDPRNDSFVDGPSVSYRGYAGGVLCPDGRVALVPDTASYIYLFDPETNTATTVRSASVRIQETHFPCFVDFVFHHTSQVLISSGRAKKDRQKGIN